MRRQAETFIVIKINEPAVNPKHLMQKETLQGVLQISYLRLTYSISQIEYEFCHKGYE